MLWDRRTQVVRGQEDARLACRSRAQPSFVGPYCEQASWRLWTWPLAIERRSRHRRCRELAPLTRASAILAVRPNLHDLKPHLDRTSLGVLTVLRAVSATKAVDDLGGRRLGRQRGSSSGSFGAKLARVLIGLTTIQALAEQARLYVLAQFRVVGGSAARRGSTRASAC